MVDILPALLLLSLTPAASSRQFDVPSLLETLYSLCRSLGAGGVIFYGGGDNPGLGAAVEVRLQRGLAKRQVLVASTRLDYSPPPWTVQGWSRRPLAVLLSADNRTAALLDQGRLSTATWLVLSRDGGLPEPLQKSLPLGSRLLAASPGLGESVDLAELWTARPGSSLHQRRYATWVPHAGFVSFSPGNRKSHTDLQGARLSVAVVHNPPITELKTVNGSLEVHGYFGSVWQVLERILNFRTEYVIPEDQSTGKAIDDTSCDGMLGLLRCKKVDVALGAFSYGAHEPTAFRYSMPLLLTSYRIFIQRPPGDTMRWSDFLRPFSWTLWVCLVCTILVIALCLSLCHEVGRIVGNEEAIGPSRYGFLDSLLAVYGAFCSQGQDVTPRATSCRAAFITAYITSVTILASYSAALISSITITRATLPFADLEGIVANGGFNFGFVNQSEIFFFFTDSNHSVHRRAYQQLVLRDPDNLPPSCLAGLQRACDPEARFAFMATEDNVLALTRETTCSLVALQTSWNMVNLAFAVAATSPYRTAFDRCLHLLRDGGVLHKHRQYDRPRSDVGTEAPSFSSVTLEAVLPILAVLGASCVAALGLLLLERLRRRRTPAASSSVVGSRRTWGFDPERPLYGN